MAARRVAAAPAGDTANACLLRFLAGLFDVPDARVRLLRGHRSRDKLIAVESVRDLPAALAKLASEDA